MVFADSKKKVWTKEKVLLKNNYIFGRHSAGR